jgi:RNA polymerase sigma-70 factor (sigma-E family)
MSRWHDGRDETTFGALVAECTGPLLRTAYLLCYDAHEAEDLVQETWARLARRWQRDGRVDNPAAYARRVLVNAAIDSQPARARRRLELGSGSDADVIALADRHSARALREVEDQDELSRAMARLTRRQRAVLVLRYFDDLPVQTVADVLGCSVGTVKSTASRALNALRDDNDVGQLPQHAKATASVTTITKASAR